MNVIDYNYSQVPSYRADQDVGSVSDPLRLHDSNLQHQSLEGGYGDLGNYSVRTSRMLHANELIGKKELGSFTQETYFDRRNHLFRINNGDQQPPDSSSKLPSLIQHGIIDNPSVPREPSLSVCSSHNWRKGAAEDAGSLWGNQTVVSRFVECDGNNMVSDVGIKQVVSDGITHSPEQISSITVCSDGEPFETGSTFSKGLLNAMDTGRHSESNQVCPLPVHSSIAEYGVPKYSNACNSQQLNVLRHQLSCQEPDQMRSGKLPVAQSRDLASGDEHETCTLGEISLELPQHSTEQQYEIQQQTSCVVQHVDAANAFDSNNISLHEVLLQYANFKSFPQNAESSRDTFLKNLHLRMCNVKTCKCNKYRALIFHYDTCHLSACVVCSPCRKLTSTDTVHKGFENSEMDISRALHKNKCNVNSSSIDENIQPPPKRPRIQDVFLSENEPSSLANLLEDEPLRNEESSYSGKSSEYPYCNNEEPNCVQEKDESNFTSMDGQAECGGEFSREIISDGQIRKTSEGKKLLAVSLTDCFTAEQIKEHICSLNPSMGQHIKRGEKESTLETSVGENTCQLCSMDKLLLSPPPIYCSFCCICIKRNLNYWTLDKMDAKKIFCTRCIKGSQGNSISFQGISFSKSELKREKNDAETEESWVQCDKCENWQHQVCALYNAKKDLDGKAKYTCPICRLQEMEVDEHLTLPATFGAKDLPRTATSDHIEQRLSVKLKAEREARAKKLGESFDKVPEATDLTVRVVSSMDKLLKVKEHFLNIFLDEGYPSEFPYKSKVILLFQKIEGVDVCLFIMYAQEFGLECAQPNQRCIYISYLDSVKYFRPHVETVNGGALRTFVYQEILIGYLGYCKKQGFATCYIWACPPQKGEDYIFFCHPETQKSPKPDKLVQWYKSMLRKGMEEDIILDFTNLYDSFFKPREDCNTQITAARLPYFDGDFWPSKAEEMIPKVEIESGGDFEKNVKKVLRNRTLKAMGRNELTTNAAKDILLMQKLGHAIFPVKEQFIIIHLLYTCKRCHGVLPGSHQHSEQSNHHHLCSRCLRVGQNLNQRKTRTSASAEEYKISEPFQIQVKGIPADTAENDIFETRTSFLHFCQENHYQFGTLRRAKHSSMMTLYHLHKQVPLTTGRTCSICLKDIVKLAGWHCGACPKFDVCITCYHENGEGCHSHKLIQVSPKFECGINKYLARQQRVLKLQDVLNILVHSSSCCQTKSNPCLYPGCSRLKNVFQHVTGCDVRATRGCEKCKKIWWLLHIHSSQCSDGSCLVPRCLDMKKKLWKECSQRLRRCEVAGMTDHPI